MSNDEMDRLIEATSSAWRARSVDGRILAPPEWYDLPPEARERAYALQAATRRLESALDPRGWSGTVHAVLARLGME